MVRSVTSCALVRSAFAIVPTRGRYLKPYDGVKKHSEPFVLLVNDGSRVFS